MSLRLAGRNAIVTGTSSGIGRAIALAYAREGASVMCADLQPDGHAKAAGEHETHALIIEQGGKAAFTATNVTDEDQVKALVAATVKAFGRLDIIVNCAGVAPEIFGIASQPGGVRIHETSTKIFDQTMAVNVRGMFLGCKYAIQQLLAQEPLPPNSRGEATRGWIVNVASLAGIVVLGGAPCYTTSKHAAVGLTKQIGVDYARDKIHCNAICPSFVETPMIAPVTKDTANPIAVGTTQALKAAHPWGALGTVEDVASGAVFLASADAQWMTATPLIIDGGYSAQ